MPGREAQLELLSQELRRQIGGAPVEHLVDPGPEVYGFKMRRTTERAGGEYVCWMDDDDWPMPGYVEKILAALERGPDVVTFGSHTPPHRPAWLRANVEDNCREERGGTVKTANHYCAWKRDIALAAPWLPRNYGAEYAWYTALSLGFPDLYEVHVPELLHEYRYDAKGTLCQSPTARAWSLAQGRRVLILMGRDDPVIMYAVGDNQPLRGVYSVQMPNGARWDVDEHSVVVLREVHFR